MIIFTRARAASENVLCVIATRDTAEAYQADARAYQYRHAADLLPGEHWYYEDFRLSVQDVGYFTDPAEPPTDPYFVLLSAEGDVYHFSDAGRYQERIEGAGTAAPDSKSHGKTLNIGQIGGRLYASGGGGQIYVRAGRNDWRLLTDALLFDMDAYLEAGDEGPDFDDPDYVQWTLDFVSSAVARNVSFYGHEGLAEDAIYLCGTVGPGTKPVLAYWDGTTLEELPVPLSEAALTGIHIEHEDSVWVCGREGVLLHGSRARGFNPVPGDRRLNLFHHITSYRGRLVMPASVRPGGLWQQDPKTGAFGHFEPRLPPLTKPPADRGEPHGGPFFAQAIGDVLWVVAPRDIFRFDGTAWERIEHPDVP